jgi:transcriptional pleiotropic regulator of transition state genes
LKATGFVRKIDDVGRFLLPFELRREMGISEHDSIEIFTHGEYIILKKCAPACVFCDGTEGLQEFRGKVVCGECAAGVVGK